MRDREKTPAHRDDAHLPHILSPQHPPVTGSALLPPPGRILLSLALCCSDLSPLGASHQDAAVQGAGKNQLSSFPGIRHASLLAPRRSWRPELFIIHHRGCRDRLKPEAQLGSSRLYPVGVRLLCEESPKLATGRGPEICDPRGWLNHRLKPGAESGHPSPS